MRLHHLRVTAFGPFAGTESVDFDVLGADGLFLLHGPTGAGKTTVLDAVAFALFGALPGARQDPDGRRLRSDHAAAGVAPRVELELTVGGRRLRIDRRPEHQRAKKRGSGTTTEQASASLTWLDTPGAEGLTRIDEVGREVARLVGMSADQFFQVVLLPQGEFARFLRAGTDERAALLQRLFDTARFGAAQDWLAERRRSTTAAAVEAEQQVQVLLGQLATAAAGPDDLPEVTQALGWAGGLTHAAAAAEQGADHQLTAARADSATAATALRRAEDALALVARRDRARHQLHVLDAAEHQRRLLTDRVTAAGQAEPVLAAAAESAAADAADAAAAAAAGAARSEVTADPDGAAAVQAGSLSTAVPAWRTEVGALAELAELAAAQDGHDARLQHLTGRQRALQAARLELTEQCDQVPVRRAQAEATLRATQAAAVALPSLAGALERAKEAASAAAQVPPLRRAHQAGEADHTAAQVEHQRLREDWLDLRELRLDGMAAELAGALRTGHACGVCGSTEHPRPAPGALQVVTDADEQAAHARERSAGQVLQRAAAAVTAALRELDAALARSAGLDVDAADAALGAAERACTEAQQRAEQAAAAERAVAEVGLEAARLTAEVQRTAQEQTAVDTESVGLAARAAAARARLDAARGEDADVVARRRRLEALCTRAARLLAATATADTATDTATERARRAQALAVQAGFAGLGAARAARLEPAELTGARRLLQDAQDTRAAGLAVLAEPEIAAVEELTEPAGRVAVGRAAERAEAAEAELAAAQGARATAAQRHVTLAQLRTRLVERLDVLGPQVAEAQRVAALADVVAGRGQNARKMSLHSYVLAARLEQVAAAASQRLRRMSAGRYEFVHSDAAGPRGTRGGLGLDVLDDHTGAVRSTKTLSGGEAFLASLSLALGLADVVAAEAGGVAMDTLFIDEGFGSLDPGTLEEVMAVLDELRSGGRVVGLVSHVDELRQRIPNRLQVTSSRTGSHLRAGVV